MAKAEGDFFDRVQQWAAGNVTGSEGDPIVSDQEIRDYLDTQVGSFGTVYDDPVNLPAGASERQQLFTNEVDMFRHWASSGLLYTDANGNIVANPMIHIVTYYDEYFETDVYQVYIDSDTGATD